LYQLSNINNVNVIVNVLLTLLSSMEFSTRNLSNNTLKKIISCSLGKCFRCKAYH